MSKSTPKKPARTTKPSAKTTAIWNKAVKAIKPGPTVTAEGETEGAKAARVAVFSGAAQGLRALQEHQQKAGVPAGKPTVRVGAAPAVKRFPTP